MVNTHSPTELLQGKRANNFERDATVPRWQEKIRILSGVAALALNLDFNCEAEFRQSVPQFGHFFLVQNLPTRL